MSRLTRAFSVGFLFTSLTFGAGVGVVRRLQGLSSVPTISSTSWKEEAWKEEAEAHRNLMDDLLFPQIKDADKSSLKVRMHAVASDPIYNFLHKYYRYSQEELKRYSPGLDTQLFYTEELDLQLLHPRYLVVEGTHAHYAPPPKPLAAEGRFGWIQLSNARDIMKNTSLRSPFLGCYGLHEWAMLYRANSPKQPTLKLRVPQSTIDTIVEDGIKCTHYDAFRFFAEDAKPMNMQSELTRESQVENEQPGCIHATMDLFKFAYRIYPLVSSILLRRTLELAITARMIDMRASPYDVASFEGCEDTIYIETTEGRKKYQEAQVGLLEMAMPLREELLCVYEQILQN